MAHTNETLDYKLPQFVDTDQPTWLGDFNGAMLSIDTAIHDAATKADQAGKDYATLNHAVEEHTTQIEQLETDTGNLATTVSGLEETVADHTASIAELHEGLDSLENSTKYDGITNHVTNAAALFRTKGNYDREGGCPCGDDLYAIYGYGSGVSQVTLYEVSTGTVVATYDVGDTEFHGNGMSYYKGELILAGSSATTKGTQIYFFQVTNSSITLTKTISAAQFGLGACWGFGHYKDTDNEYYWATDYLVNFYYVNKACTVSSKIGSVYLPSSAGMEYSTQQACSYSKEYSVFLSCRSNCINVYTDKLKYIKTIPIDETLGFVWREEIEQATIYNGKLWLHNNPIGTTAFTDNHIGCVWSVDVGTEMPKGWGHGDYNSFFGIVFDGATQVPTSTDGNPNTQLTVGYMQDVSAVQAQLGDIPYNVVIRASSNDVLFILKHSQIKGGEKSWAGIYAMAGYTIYEASELYKNLKNARFESLFSGVSNITCTLYSEFPSGITSGGKKVAQIYGGTLLVRNSYSVTNIKDIDTERSYALWAIE
jgi:hypothetical protein